MSPRPEVIDGNLYFRIRDGSKPPTVPADELIAELRKSIEAARLAVADADAECRHARADLAHALVTGREPDRARHEAAVPDLEACKLRLSVLKSQHAEAVRLADEHAAKSAANQAKARVQSILQRFDLTRFYARQH